MQEKEKKKLGFFGTIKNILFVEEEGDDNSTPELPDYTEKKEEVREEVNEEPRVNISRVNPELVNNNDLENRVEIKEVEEEKKEAVVEEQESPFFSFDADEFERLTSRVARNEARNLEPSKDDLPTLNNIHTPINNSVRHDNNRGTANYSSVSNSGMTGKKPFTPSPFISPVYGILDKNYSKDDIVDKRTDRKKQIKDNIDRVRSKAFGELKAESIVEEKEEKVEIIDRAILPIEEETVVEEKPITREERKKIEEVNNTVELVEDNIEIEAPVIEEKKIDVIEDNKKPLEDELDKMLSSNAEDELVADEEPRKSAKLDDLEKTSTLKILDDIEKELNNIKPITETSDEVDTNEDDQTFEKDIFDMISSMYEGGDEEDDSD